MKYKRSNPTHAGKVNAGNKNTSRWSLFSSQDGWNHTSYNSRPEQNCLNCVTPNLCGITHNGSRFLVGIETIIFHQYKSLET